MRRGPLYFYNSYYSYVGNISFLMKNAFYWFACKMNANDIRKAGFQVAVDGKMPPNHIFQKNLKLFLKFPNDLFGDWENFLYLCFRFSFKETLMIDISAVSGFIC